MSYLKERIKHAVRFRNKRGYGVHSPFMFNLILNVIRDKEKLFTYPEALEKSGGLSQREKKVFRLLSRLIRYLKASRVVCLGYNAGVMVRYLSEVYPGASIWDNQTERLNDADFVYVGRKACEMLPAELKNTWNVTPKYMVIADIYKDSFNGHLWSEYREKATVSVDMMWYGLLFFDEKIQRGKYSLII